MGKAEVGMGKGEGGSRNSEVGRQNVEVGMKRLRIGDCGFGAKHRVMGIELMVMTYCW